MPGWTSPSSSSVGLRALSLLMGIFLVFMALDKTEWFGDAGILTGRLEEWRDSAGASSRWYLETIAIPGAPLFARLVPLAEIAAGMALILGFKVRLAAAAVFLMVLNFHFAADIVFHYSYLTNAYGLPLLGGLLALAIGGTRLPLALST
jgi:uncharacterized membrane protein YphA (DoxX/SURF4 family)